MPTPTVLNAQPPWDGPATDAGELGTRLQKIVLSLQGTFFAEDGSGVDYAALQNSAEFAEYRLSARELQRADMASLVSAPDARRCFFLNLYNALTVHAVVAATEERGGAPLASVAEVGGFWRRFAYNVGGEVFTLDDIEHGVLRGDRPHPSALCARSFFPPGDPRARLAVPIDPRVHFALNCGARSCPPIRVFTPANLERGLALAAASFCAATVQARLLEVVDDGAGAAVVELSQILKWYGGDFGATQLEALRRVAGYLPEGADAKRTLEALLGREDAAAAGKAADAGGATRLQRAYNWALGAGLGPSAMRKGPVAVRWLPYDWSLNHSG